MSAETFAPVLAKLPLFNEIGEQQQSILAKYSRQKSLRRGEILFHSGDVLAGFYVVLSGQIKLTVISPKGSEKVMDLIGAGRSFAEALVFLNKPTPVTAQAVEASKIILVPSEQVKALVESSSSFVYSMLAGLSRRLHHLISDMESYCLQSSTQRVVGYLLAEADKQNHDQVLNLVIELPANKNLIASMLNLTPESFSRALHTLTDAKVISVHRRRIEIFSLDELYDYIAQL